MKIIFYGTDSAAAKAHQAKLRAAKTPVRLVQADACYEAEPNDGIDFMPDVPDFDRKRLTTLFGSAKEAESAPAAKTPKPALAVSKGPGGRLYIKNGKDIHSGPFATQDEADAALAKEVGE